MLNNLKSILPRVHWSAEELAEGAFVVGVNTTTPVPAHHTAPNITKLVLEGANKTIATILDVLGGVARDTMTAVIIPNTADVAPTPPTSGAEVHPTVPYSGSGPTPPEVGSTLKVVFVVFILLEIRHNFLLKTEMNSDSGQGQLLLRLPCRLRPWRPLP